jgi:Tol biopolymer transport system component
LVQAEEILPNPEWSRDGRYLVYQELSVAIRYVEIGADGRAGEPITFLATPAREGQPSFSPDGRFLAYVSDESGRTEVYVRPFPSGTGRWQASVDGGAMPRWSRDGNELFYVNGSVLMSVSVSTTRGVALGLPQELFRSNDLRARAPVPSYDVSADGQRFLTLVREADLEDAPTETDIHVVQNWYEEFRNRE